MMRQYPQPVLIERVRGDATQLDMPAHGQALRAAGTEFLTRAFHAFGSLALDNRVTHITQLEAYGGGNSGEKVLLSVRYARAQPGLHTDLFVKFSRDFNDAFRDRRRFELEAEVRFAKLSRHPAFPVQVPHAYFADFNHAAGTGMLVTERIAFGRGGIEPLRHKCMDHELPDPLVYYRSIIVALARLVAAHKSGVLSPALEALFPFDARAAVAEDPIPWDAGQLRELTARYAAFAAACPSLVPAPLAEVTFVAKFEREALRFVEHAATVKQFLYSDPDFVALCHYNANIDNAWFSRGARGTLECGLLDWGRARQMNVAYCLWGCLCTASLPLWEAHFDELLSLFVTELHSHGGPRLEPNELKLHLHCYVATMGLATILQAPALILARLPQVREAQGALDPILFQDEVARNFLHVLKTFLNVWRTQDVGASLDRVLGRGSSAGFS